MSTELEAENDLLRGAADRLAAALALALYDAHPTYANTSGWRGGIGGQALTTSCSLLNPPPSDIWMDAGLDLLSTPLRDFMRNHPDFDLQAAKDTLRTELRAVLDGPR